MSTVQYNSTYLGYALNKSDTWNSGYAAQGAAKAGQPRDGLMLYSGLRNGSVSWPNQSVTEVRLYLDFGTAGASARKYIGLYASSRNSAGGVGSAVRGTYLGQFRTATTTYGAKETVTFNSGTNAEVFDALKNWIEYGSTYGLVMFMNETNSSSYTTNFLNVDGSNIQIDYVVKGSSGTVTPDPVDIGSDVVLDIDPVVVTGTLTHTVEFECGSVTSGVISLAEGVDQYTYTTPSTWIDELGGASSGTATCTLTTYIDGVETGSRTISFTAQVPDAYAPVINSFAVARYSSYVDDYGVTQYKEDLEGGYVWVNMSAQMDTSSGLTPSLEINYWPLDDETDITNVPIAWTGTGTPSTMTLTDDRTIITAAVPIANGYVFELTFTNGNQTVTARSTVQKSWATFHVAGTGYGVGVGMFSPGTQAEPSFDVAWPMNGNGGANIANLNSYASGEQFTGGYWTDGKPIYRYIMSGTVSGTGDKTLGNMPSTPDHVIRMYGEFIHESATHRPIAFTSYGGIAWSLSPVVVSKAVHLYIGSNFNNPNTHSYILVLEYTKA